MEPSGRHDDRRTAQFQRIVIACDSGLEDPKTVDMAAALAVRLRAELFGLFVENIDWVRLSEQPELRTFSVSPAASRSLASEQLRRALKRQSAHLHRAIEEAAARRRLRYHFEVRRGRLLAELLGTTTASDLIVVGMPANDSQQPWNPTEGQRAATARAICEARTQSVLLLRPKPLLGQTIICAFDNSADAHGALAAAGAFVEPDGSALIVVLITARPAEAAEWQRQISSNLAESGLRVRAMHMPKAGLEDLVALSLVSRAALLAMPAEVVLAAGDAAPRLLQRSQASVLMVRSDRAMPEAE